MPKIPSLPLVGWLEGEMKKIQGERTEGNTRGNEQISVWNYYQVSIRKSVHVTLYNNRLEKHCVIISASAKKAYDKS